MCNLSNDDTIEIKLTAKMTVRKDALDEINKLTHHIDYLFN